MTDREKLLTALLQESDRRAGPEVSVLDVIAILNNAGVEYRHTKQHKTAGVAA